MSKHVNFSRFALVNTYISDGELNKLPASQKHVGKIYTDVRGEIERRRQEAANRYFKKMEEYTNIIKNVNVTLKEDKDLSDDDRSYFLNLKNMAVFNISQMLSHKSHLGIQQLKRN